MIFLRVLVLTLWEGDATFLMLTFEVTHRCKTRGIRFGRRNYDWGSFYFYISIWIWLWYPHLHVLIIYHSILSTLYFFAIWYGELCCFFHAPEVNQSTSNSLLQNKNKKVLVIVHYIQGHRILRTLIILFKLIFSHFKKHYTHFHIFFHLHIFQKTPNNNSQTHSPNKSL